MRFVRWMQRDVAVAAAVALVGGLVIGSSVTWALARRNGGAARPAAMASAASPTPTAAGQGLYTVVSIDDAGTVRVSAPGGEERRPGPGADRLRGLVPRQRPRFLLRILRLDVGLPPGDESADPTNRPASKAFTVF